jgi:hypothetical protein
MAGVDEDEGIELDEDALLGGSFLFWLPPPGSAKRKNQKPNTQ